MVSKFILPMFMTIASCAFLCLMTDFRYGKKRTIITLLVGMAAIIVSNLAAYLLLHFDFYSRIAPLTLHIPMLMLFLLLSKYRDFRTIFSWLTSASLVYLITLTGLAFTFLFAGFPAADYAGRLAAAILLFLLWRKLRPLYLSMQRTLERGWGIFCFLPLGYYVAAYLFIIRVPMSLRGANLSLQLLMTCVVAAAYCLLFLFFRQMRQSMMRDKERQLLKTQVVAFSRQSEALRQGERQISILRHDMRHYVIHIASLLRTGKMEEALRLTDHIDDTLLHSAPVRWCDNDMLNPLIAYYLRLAGQYGIEVETQLDLPQSISVDETELSIVLANALENAIHACLRQPEGEPRRIILNAVSAPQLAVKIANTFGGEVKFDQRGIPIADERAHGTGAQSIAAFAEKHKATCHYSIENGLFCLYLLL